jgi:hypothetical protein
MLMKKSRDQLIELIASEEARPMRVASHRDKWDHISDFGGILMPLEEALEYVVSDAPGYFGIDFPVLKKSRL